MTWTNEKELFTNAELTIGTTVYPSRTRKVLIGLPNFNTFSEILFI